jgi:hypothetical protein
MATVAELIDRDLGRALSKSARRNLEEACGPAPCLAVGCSMAFTTVVALTDDRLLVVTGRSKVDDFPLCDLHSLSVLDTGALNGEVLLCPLRINSAFEPVPLGPNSAERILPLLRQRIGELHQRGEAWWDDPLGKVEYFLGHLELLVAPPDSGITGKSDYSLAIVNTGLQLRRVRSSDGDPDVRRFIPWSKVVSFGAEGPDQVQMRPSVAAVVTFGVLGLAARQKIRRSFLVVGTESGEIVLETQRMLALELQALLSPVLRHFTSDTASALEPGSDSDSPLDVIRHLGELRDAGFITPEEFDAKKAELLKRI